MTFYLAQDTQPGTGQPPNSNELLATFDGIILDDLTAIPVEGYTEYTDTVGVTDASSILDITLGNDLGEFLLDDVSVAATTTPEPVEGYTEYTDTMVGFAFRRKVIRKGTALRIQ